MKNINIPLEDEEYNEMSKKKGKLTWREYFLKPIKKNKT